MKKFFLLLLLAGVQCKKSYPPPNILPPLTQEGKNTFGCNINGLVWIPYYACGLIEIPNRCKELSSLVSVVDTSRKLPIDWQLTVIRELKPGGGAFSAFYLGARIGQTGNLGSFFSVTYRKDSIYYNPQYPINNASNAINVTRVDTLNQIISGTFYFTLFNSSDPKDSVVVTDGRFDVTYKACLCH